MIVLIILHTISRNIINEQMLSNVGDLILAVVTYKTRTTSTPAYLSHLIHDYNPGRCLRSADKLTVLHTSLALSAKAFSVSCLELSLI